MKAIGKRHAPRCRRGDDEPDAECTCYLAAGGRPPASACQSTDGVVCPYCGEAYLIRDRHVGKGRKYKCKALGCDREFVVAAVELVRTIRTATVEATAAYDVWNAAVAAFYRDAVNNGMDHAKAVAHALASAGPKPRY